ncbi:MAG: methylated-DNA--[protein]-cysteine S-methyltransferase [Ruminococcus sp.]|nr:methylated-DNA--[protein]-cysteine S-methyltransferase [Ruminococcus sp.]
MNKYSYDTPVGIITVEDDGDFVTAIYTDNKKSSDKESELAKVTFRQLTEYFNRKRKIFDLPIKVEGTDFQKSVWKELCNIPYGTTCSYKQVAENIGNPKACRAVGMANNKNKIMIVVPCHRVIGSNGSLVGYAGGLNVKKFLLDLEQVNL